MPGRLPTPREQALAYTAVNLLRWALDAWLLTMTMRFALRARNAAVVHTTLAETLPDASGIGLGGNGSLAAPALTPTVVAETDDAVNIRAGGEHSRNPADQFCSNERIAAVQTALNELPPSQREVIKLRLEDGLDHQAISEQLGISRQAVEVRLCRGRANLKERLHDIMTGDL